MHPLIVIICLPFINALVGLVVIKCLAPMPQRDAFAAWLDDAPIRFFVEVIYQIWPVTLAFLLWCHTTGRFVAYPPPGEG